jgi:hypothetical protein
LVRNWPTVSTARKFGSAAVVGAQNVQALLAITLELLMLGCAQEVPREMSFTTYFDH